MGRTCGLLAAHLWRTCTLSVGWRTCGTLADTANVPSEGKGPSEEALADGAAKARTMLSTFAKADLIFSSRGAFFACGLSKCSGGGVVGGWGARNFTRSDVLGGADFTRSGVFGSSLVARTFSALSFRRFSLLSCHGAGGQSKRG